MSITATTYYIATIAQELAATVHYKRPGDISISIEVKYSEINWPEC